MAWNGDEPPNELVDKNGERYAVIKVPYHGGESLRARSLAHAERDDVIVNTVFSKRLGVKVSYVRLIEHKKDTRTDRHREDRTLSDFEKERRKEKKMLKKKIEKLQKEHAKSEEQAKILRDDNEMLKALAGEELPSSDKLLKRGAVGYCTEAPDGKSTTMVVVISHTAKGKANSEKANRVDTAAVSESTAMCTPKTLKRLQETMAVIPVVVSTLMKRDLGVSPSVPQVMAATTQALTVSLKGLFKGYAFTKLQWEEKIRMRDGIFNPIHLAELVHSNGSFNSESLSGIRELENLEKHKRGLIASATTVNTRNRDTAVGYALRLGVDVIKSMRMVVMDIGKVLGELIVATGITHRGVLLDDAGSEALPKPRPIGITFAWDGGMMYSNKGIIAVAAKITDPEVVGIAQRSGTLFSKASKKASLRHGVVRPDPNVSGISEKEWDDAVVAWDKVQSNNLLLPIACLVGDDDAVSNYNVCHDILSGSEKIIKEGLIS